MFFITSFITWHGFSDMVDVCEIPFHLTVIEYVDGAPFQDGGSEQPWGHVGSAPRAIDREVARTAARKTVKVAIPMSHSFWYRSRCPKTNPPNAELMK
jgi:hypothetical protein